MSAYLTRLTRKAKSTPFLVLDLESKDGPSRIKAGFTRPFMVGVYDGTSYAEFRDLEPKRGRWQARYFWRDGCVAQAMRHILTKKYSGHHIYAHNGGKFDYLFLLPWLMHEGRRLGYHFQIIPVSSAIQLLDVWKDSVEGGTMRWRFLDSFRLMPTSLQKAAKSFGMEGKVDHDLNTHESDPSWSVYLKQDCTELHAILTKFHDYIENVLCGEVGMTAPSTSMKLFRRRYLKQDVPRTIESHEFIRRGYFGGRVEVFRREGEKLRYFDINSSYPRAMLEAMPGGEGQRWEGEPPDFLKQRIGFVECDVHVPEDVIIPPLPVKLETDEPETSHANGKLIFPVGNLSGTWEWSELQKAMELGCAIERWGVSWWYEPVYLFEDFVTELYKYREKSSPFYDEGLAAVVKIMLNSLYGKFGMKTLRRQIYRWDDPYLPKNAVPASPDPDCFIYYAEKEVDAAYIMPQISARVTALGRIRLLDAMLAAKKLGGELYYCDTDSIITDVELPSSTKLGELKDEYPQQSGRITGKFLGPKLYVLQCEDWECIAAKGFEERTSSLIERLARGETIVQNRLEKVGTMARRGFLSGPKMVRVPRGLHFDKGKREMFEDGSTKPWRLEMWS